MASYYDLVQMQQEHDRNARCETCKHWKVSAHDWPGRAVCWVISHASGEGESGAKVIDSYPDNPALATGPKFRCSLYET